MFDWVPIVYLSVILRLFHQATLFIQWHNDIVVRLQRFIYIESRIKDWMQQTVDGDIDINSFYNQLRNNLVDRLTFACDWAGLIPLVGDDALEADVLHHDIVAGLGFGPGGVSRLIHIFSCVYDAVARLQCFSSQMDRGSTETEKLVVETSKSTLQLIFYMRGMIHRSLYDPSGGFRELAHILKIHDPSLPVCQSQPIALYVT